MIGALGELFRHEGSAVKRAAVVTDVRGGDYFEELHAVLEELDHDGLELKVLFLEAEEQTLLDRFKETRRRHPLAPDGRVIDGIRAEREVLGPLREQADVVMDTSDLTGRDAAAPDLDRAARAARLAPSPGADPADVRLQERAAPRRGPDVRRALPAEPALP